MFERFSLKDLQGSKRVGVRKAKLGWGGGMHIIGGEHYILRRESN